jgi:phospholipase/carboxylesterase
MSGGDDGRGGGDGPAILLCHGFGAPGDDLCDLARVIDAGKGVRWLFPEAPLVVDVGPGTQGRAWWPIDMMRLQMSIMRGEHRSLAGETPEGLGSATGALEGCISELVRSHGIQRDRLLIGGFSQGAMLTTEVALFAKEPFAGLAVLSGALVSEVRWREAAKASGPSLHALMSHGRADPLLLFDGAEALRKMLEESGAKVDWVPHNGQHEIPMAVVERLAAFARSRLR